LLRETITQIERVLRRRRYGREPSAS
jgi:hypothetical protein